MNELENYSLLIIICRVVIEEHSPFSISIIIIETYYISHRKPLTKTLLLLFNMRKSS